MAKPTRPIASKAKTIWVARLPSLVSVEAAAARAVLLGEGVVVTPSTLEEGDADGGETVLAGLLGLVVVL